MGEQSSRAAANCAIAAVGAAVLLYAGHEALKFATGQAIIAGAALPALTVALLVVVAGAAVAQLAKS